MRYWVYKDSQILGPLAKEDLGLAGGVRPETLVCAEDSAGRMDADWRCAEEIEELSGLCAAAPELAGDDLLFEPGLRPDGTAAIRGSSAPGRKRRPRLAHRHLLTLRALREEGSAAA